MASLAEANLIAARAFAGATTAAGRAGAAMSKAMTNLRPDVRVEITVGAGVGKEAELLTRFFTRLGSGGVGDDMTSTRGRLALEHVTQQHASAGFSTADAAVVAIYQSIATLNRYAPPPAHGYRG
jgi:hypothetical protein